MQLMQNIYQLPKKQQPQTLLTRWNALGQGNLAYGDSEVREFHSC